MCCAAALGIGLVTDLQLLRPHPLADHQRRLAMNPRAASISVWKEMDIQSVKIGNKWDGPDTVRCEYAT